MDPVEKLVPIGLGAYTVRGRDGVLHRISFGNYANQIHPWSFRVNKGSSLTCMPKSGKKNKSFPLNLPAIRKMYL